MARKKQQADAQNQESRLTGDREKDHKLPIAPFEKVSMDVSAVEEILDKQIKDLIDIFGKKKFKLLKELDQKLEDLKDDLRGNEIFKILYAIFNKIEQQQDDEGVVYLGKKDADKEEAALQIFLNKIGKKFGKINKHDVKRYAKIKDIQSSKDVAILIFSTFGDIRYILNFSRQIGMTSTIIHLLMDKKSAIDELNQGESDFFGIISKHFASLSGMIDKESVDKYEIYDLEVENFVEYIEKELNIEISKATMKDVRKYCKVYNEKNAFHEYCEKTKKMALNKNILDIIEKIQEEKRQLGFQKERLKNIKFDDKGEKQILQDISKINTKISVIELELERKKHGWIIKKGLSPENLYRIYKNKYKNRSSK